MRRRLLALSTLALSILLAALLGPLISTYASDRTQELFVTRQADLNRFAVVAANALETGSVSSLRSELDRYEEVHGARVVVVDAGRRTIAASSGDLEPASVPRQVTRALAGNSAEKPAPVWPWSDDTFVLASPIGRDAHVLGAVLMEASTQGVRDDVAARLALLVVAGLAVLLVAAAGVAVPLVRWILRPVDDLDEAARRVAHGDLATRVPASAGPPELRRLATSFNAMANHVQVAQRQQSDLVADASHQLGNPLTALRLRVETLSADAEPEDAAQLDLVLAETDRLTRIVDSLLDLGQIGAEPPPVTEVDVAAAVRARCRIWEQAVPGLTVGAPDRILALATVEVVDVVLDATLDNATKFALGSPVEVTVGEVTIRAADATETAAVEIRVRDNGSGVRDEDLAKVGARFFRGAQHQNVHGTGLGLAIVRAHVVQLGGTFAVGRPPGGGFEVRVTLRSPAPGSSAARRGAAPAAR
ncbi:HAMP domain-containing sensor histidine kinase [Mumia sp. ZJ430]|uniref:sensor histidine kinase n=1 Tax=Mumia sp. ZJ430 TaxID=2708083 RepID=UPI001420B588|nr:HAMP domain-containing sensor histidine kinase [Mumia sp. ZJ430]